MKITIEVWEERIENAIKINGPYSHNIISLALSSVAKDYGVKEANRLIDDFDLESLGWQKQEEK